jgi:hypothetical protein
MYNESGRVPWSTGYQETRDVFVQEALADESIPIP